MAYLWRELFFTGSDLMTQAQKERIAGLQRAGLGYRKIAAELEMPVDTVKSYCRRHPLPQYDTVCAHCGKLLVQTPHKKKKRFCCDQCRMAWWKAHPDQIVRKKVYAHICHNCGETFHSHRANSQYCSRKCFAEFRRSGVGKWIWNCASVLSPIEQPCRLFKVCWIEVSSPRKSTLKLIQSLPKWRAWIRALYSPEYRWKYAFLEVICITIRGN